MNEIEERIKDIEKALSTFLKNFRDAAISLRGMDIFEEEGVSIRNFDVEQASAEFVVESQSSSKRYHVDLWGLANVNTIRTSCACPYNAKPVCKHAVAAFHQLEIELKDLLNSAQVQIDTSSTNGSQQRTGELKGEKVKPKLVMQVNEPIHGSKIMEVTDTQGFYPWQLSQMADRVSGLEHDKNTLTGTVKDNHKSYGVSIHLTSNNRLSSTCNCGPKNLPLCRHAYAVLLAFSWQTRTYNDVLFMLRDHSGIYAKQLAEYGYSLEDDWEKDFDVQIQEMKIIVRPKDKGLSKISAFADWDEVVSMAIKPSQEIDQRNFQTKYQETGILWSRAEEHVPRYSLNVMTGKRKKNGDLGSPLRKISYDTQIEDLSTDQLGLLKMVYPTNQVLIDNPAWFDQEGEERDLLLAMDSLHDYLLEIYPKLLHEEHYLSSEAQFRDAVTARTIKRIFPQESQPNLVFDLSKQEGFYALRMRLEVDGKRVPLRKLTAIQYGVIVLGDRLYVCDKTAARTLNYFYNKNPYKVREEDLEEFENRLLRPLMEQYDVDLSFEKIEPELLDTKEDAEEIEQEDQQVKEPQEEKETFSRKVYLKEIEDNLILLPALQYNLGEGKTREVYLDHGRNIYLPGENGKPRTLIKRDQEKEQAVRKFFWDLHPKFFRSQDHYFALPVGQVMFDNWFFHAFDSLKKSGFEILGLKELKRLNYSPHRPQVRLSASSGTDWFDIQMTVSFGEQKVKLSEIRRAVLNNQNYVKLDDGSIGMLPDDWLKKYSSLFKGGKVLRENVTLSKFQFNLIDDLYGEIDNNEVFLDMIEKRERLKNFKKIKEIVLPKELKAELRNYQKEGYNWLNFLDEFGWGGCLADDMGLGKTVQVLAFLDRITEQYPNATHLVIVPRSLVFNWLKEIEKFCPHLSAMAYTGPDRDKNIKSFQGYRIIITTYGLMRSDIDILMEFPFHYIVLDESQAIKNPATLTSKAVKLLHAKNRLIMTGTPIENNTFDLFSQMDFVNPGMLGSLENFRREFAGPIDRDKNEEVAESLRKLVYPFILSRKKQEVAKELPPKTETIIYCDMPQEQRKVYDYYKDKYRNLLIQKIETEGMGKAGMYILQGLLKLRQICNSPLLLNEEEGEFTDQSAKLERLMANLTEIFAQGHKVLIFSFFKGMLKLIGDALEKEGIDYVKLTGESQNREQLVQTFKTDTTKRAFLISLKAGGFGLNLEEANYVFLIDPWWNPAVEQQAIDRTHRIGQTQQVFAYKMICKDSIEEKILKIQEKKLALSKDLIHTETGFLKKLKPEDVQDLFS